MEKVLGFEIISKISDTRGNIIFRCKKKDGDGTCIVKMLKSANTSPSEEARFNQAYEMIMGVNIPGIIKTLEVKKSEGGFALILEDYPGLMLKKLIHNQEFALDRFLDIAVDLSKTLGMLHDKNIVHQAVNPWNIIVNKENNKPKITGFGINAIITHENQEIYDQAVVTDYLAYISPEQTGRINRTPDYRSDLYSLGVTFYEMLTGRLPFSSDDPLEMIHGHIATPPVSPAEINDSVPRILSNIVMKLLAKTAEERYQNSFGLMADLEECRKQLKEKGKILSFKLAEKDVSLKFIIPQKLVGREEEVKKLIAAFETITKGESGLMLVLGNPGIGKSALIYEIHKPIVAKRGYFITGKYDQFRRDVPYSAIIQAFQGLIRQIMAESKEKVGSWRESLLKALGPNGKVIIDVIPDSELIIGKQPDVPALGPEESENRFKLVFLNFARVFATHEHPLVLFLDDLQWADFASLELIKILAIDQEMSNFLIIGSYRNNEVNETHPLTETLSGIGKAGVRMDRIVLRPLKSVNVNDFIADFLRSDRKKTRPLADLVHKKTNGNPFFVNQFIMALCNEHLIKQDPNSGWQWDIGKIAKMQVTDNVVDLMAAKIAGLKKSTREVLSICACIGNRFDLENIASVLDKSIDDVLADIDDAISEGLIGLSSQYYVFHHDRIQEAAYSLIPEKEKQATHYKIGRLALAGTSQADLRDKIFYIVNQLNSGIECLADRYEKDELVRLNLIAGKKARASAAYLPSLKYLKAGIGLMSEDCWNRNYDLSFSIYIEAAKAAYLSANFDEMALFTNLLMQKAKSVLEKIDIYEIKTDTLMAQGRPREAVDNALKALNLLKVKLPKKPQNYHFLFAFLRTKLALINKKPDDLINLPIIEDPYILASLKIMMKIASSGYFATPKLQFIVMFRAIILTIKFGIAPGTAYTYASYGGILCAIGNLDSGFKFGELALIMGKNQITGKNTARPNLIVNTYIRPWKEHAGNTLAPLLDVYQKCLDIGDLEFAALSLLVHGYHLFHCGENLAKTEKILLKTIKTLGQIKQETALNLVKINHQAVVQLLEPAGDSCCLKGDSYDETKVEKENVAANLYKLILCFIFGRYPEAVENAGKVRRRLKGMAGTLHVPVFFFYDSLARLSLIDADDKKTKGRVLKHVAKNQKLMKKFTDKAPMNNLHKYLLVEAEVARVKGRSHQAIEYYNKAINEAEKNKYIQEKAVSYELAAKFNQAGGLNETADVYLSRARRAYMEWGATAKVDDLEKKHPELAATSSGENTSNHSGQKQDNSLDKMDYMSVVSSLQTISTEIILDDLLENLMKIVIENAGAGRGIFISLIKDKLVIEAESDSSQSPDQTAKMAPLLPMDSRDDLLKPVINLTRRTKECIVLDNASAQGDFTMDPYVAEYKPKSILCLPVTRQDRLVGMLYLENNAAAGAFTNDRVKVLQLLASQAAISLENARLYENKKQAEKRLKNLLETANEGFWKIDNKGFTLDVNSEMCRILGREREDIIGRHIFEFGDKESIATVKKQTQALLRKEKLTYEVTVHRPDDTSVNCQINMAPLLESDKLTGSFAMVSDITKIKQGEKEIMSLNADLEKRVRHRTIELNATLKKVEKANRNIMASIRYAKMIQQSLLPDLKEVKSLLPQSFFIWKPKEMIGGDIYGIEKVDGGLIVAMIDCTGHGVPGAFMTMIAASGLRRTILDEGYLDPAMILNRLNFIVKTSLQQDTDHALSDDGLDAAICIVTPETGNLVYAGARLPLVYLNGNGINIIKGDRQSIGYTNSNLNFEFTNHKITVEKKTRVFMYTDGLVDQLGGLRHRRFGKKRLHQLFTETSLLPMDEQKDKILRSFKRYKGINEQQDDVTLIGFSMEGKQT